MISSYRLGDLVLVSLTAPEQDMLVQEHPDSIGSKFIAQRKTGQCIDNIDLITRIVLETMPRYAHLFPKDIEDSTVIHLRLGDVVAGNMWHEIRKRPIQKERIQALLKDDCNKKYVIGKCFFAKPSSTNYEECISKSNEYLEGVLSALGAEHFDGGNADIDLCCAIKAKKYVQGKGFYSKLITEIRKKLNLETATPGGTQ